MAITYIVEYSTAGATGPWTASSDSPVSSAADTVIGLTPATNYWFRVTAQDTSLGLTAAPTVFGPVTTGSTSQETPVGTNVAASGITINASTVIGQASTGPFTTFALDGSGNVLRNGAVDNPPGLPGGVTTLSPTDRSANYTLSNGNLTATAADAALASVRSTISKPSGKWYVEFTVTTLAGTPGLGVANAAYNLTGAGNMGGSPDAIGLGQGGDVWYNGPQVDTTVAGYGSGTRIGMAVDLDAKLIWWTHDGTAWNHGTGTPAAGTDGISIAGVNGPWFVAFGTNVGQGGIITVNFGATAFGYAVPSGFLPWNSASVVGAATRLYYGAHRTYQERDNGNSISQPSWYGDTGSGWADVASPLPITPVITVTNPGTQLTGQVFTISGVLTNYVAALTPPRLQYRDGNGGWLDLPAGATVTATSYTFDHPAITIGNPSLVVGIRDKDQQALSGASAAFAVTEPVTGGLGLFVKSPNYRYLKVGGVAKFVGAAHTWDNFQQFPPMTLTAEAWIDNPVLNALVLSSNFAPLIRFWTFQYSALENGTLHPPDSQLPFMRSSTPGALDGGNKWDLTQFNNTFFNRLAQVVAYAGSKGVYCQIMLFIGDWGHDNFNWSPYNQANNINNTGLTDQRKENELGTSGASAVVQQFMRALVTRFVQTLYQFDNVVWEVINEVPMTSGTLAWVNDIMATIRSVETAMPGGLKHLVLQGAGANWINNSWPNVTFGVTGADVISSGWGDGGPYDGFGSYGDVPAGGKNGNQVVIADSDHQGPLTVNYDNVVRAFVRGFGGYEIMDVGDGDPVTEPMQAPIYAPLFTPNNLSARRGLKAVSLACSFLPSGALNNIAPNDSIASTGYALADTTNFYYVVYQPSGGSSFTVNLAAANGKTFNMRWVDATLGTQLGSTTTYTATAATNQGFSPPSNGGAVMLVLSWAVSSGTGPRIIGTYDWNYDKPEETDANITRYETVMNIPGQVNCFDTFGLWSTDTAWGGDNYYLFSRAKTLSSKPNIRNGVPCIGIKFYWHDYVWNGPDGLQAFLAGHMDQCYRDTVNALADVGYAVSMWRLSYEGNFGFMPDFMGWDANQWSLWKQCCHRASDLIRNQAAIRGIKCLIMHNPALGRGSAPVANAKPDAAYYDISGLDVYSSYYGDGNMNDPNERRNFWDNTQGDNYSWNQHFALSKADNKGIFFPEWGVGSRPDGHSVRDDPVFIDWTRDKIVQTRAAGLPFYGMCYWDIPASDFNALISDGSQPNAAARIAQYYADGSFIGDPLPV